MDDVVGVVFTAGTFHLLARMFWRAFLFPQVAQRPQTPLFSATLRPTTPVHVLAGLLSVQRLRLPVLRLSVNRRR
jgi:hypothetical protein